MGQSWEAGLPLWGPLLPPNRLVTTAWLTKVDLPLWWADPVTMEHPDLDRVFGTASAACCQHHLLATLPVASAACYLHGHTGALAVDSAVIREHVARAVY